MLHRYTLVFFIVLLSTIVSAQDRTVINVTGTVVNAVSFVDKEVIVDGKTDLHISAKYKPLTNSIIKLNSENSWVFFDNIRPQVIVDSVLPNVYINGIQSSNKVNIRVAIYRHGCVIMPHSTDFQPLEMYSGQNYTGESQKFGLFTFNNALGAFDNKARSFKLKRGYMATLANNADGTGYSRVYIADNTDVEVPVMSSYLDNTVSFIRVFNWEWVSKKGWCQSGYMSGANAATNTNRMNGTWLYDWSAGNSSQPNFEYVPIKQNQGWPSWSQISELKNVSHLMGYNEPDHTEQSNVSVATAVKEWPNYLKTGLRLGSPATTDFNWLYQFMDSCKAHNYRVDYIVVHAYWGGLTPTQWYNQLKAVHDKTGRGIWIKEWNNGANWTTETWPTDYGDGISKQYNELKAILNVMDTAHFVERYSIYNWVGPLRMMISDDTWITPAGEFYRDNKPKVAFNRLNEIIPGYKFTSSRPSLEISAGANSTLLINWENSDQEFAKEIMLEKKAEGGTFTEIFSTNQTSQNAYNDNHDVNQTGRFRYRMRLLLNNNTEQITNEQLFDVTLGGDIQYGKLLYSGTNWNPILFKNSFSTTPVAIFGAPTNTNLGTLLSSKVKITSSKMMNFQLLPWDYQNVSTLATEETVPYFVIKPGTYDLGGLKAIASKTTVNNTWKTVMFSSSFDTIPVVMVSHTSSYNTIPTIVRIKNVTKTSFEVKLQKESKNSIALVSEIFSYLAIKPGVGSVNGNKIKVGFTPENAVGNAVTQYAKVSYGESIENPIFLAQLQTCNDDTVTATLRCRSILTTEARVFKQREVSMGYTASAFETAGYILINPDVMNGVDAISVKQLAVYPNPVNDKLYIRCESNETTQFKIYNLVGTMVKSAYLAGNSIDVSDLKPGCYMLKSAGFTTVKFVKL